MLQPLISIILCTYNGEEFLEEQLQSILNQTYPNLEIFISDDASTDGTLKILEKYSSQKNIILNVNRLNIGFIKNFELAAVSSKGDYIAFADQDDIWLADKIEKLYNAIGEHSLVYSDSTLIDAKGNYLHKNLSDKAKMQNIYNSKGFAFLNAVSGHTMMAKRALFTYAMPLPMGHYHDWWMAVQASNLNGVVYLNEKLTQYRQHNSAASKTFYLSEPKPGDFSKRYKSYLRELEWLELIKNSPIEKEKEFYNLFYNLYLLKNKGTYAWPLFWFLIKNKKDIFMFSTKSYISDLIYIRKIARGEKKF